MEYKKRIASQDEEFGCGGKGGIEQGHLYLQLKKLSVISQDPGHKFGNPVYYYDACDDDDDEDEAGEDGSHSSSSLSSVDDGRQATLVVNPHPSTSIVHRSSLESLMGSPPTAVRRPFVAETQELHELFCCTYHIHDKPIDSKVPSTEWQVDSHGIAPGPRCRWIPPSLSSDSENKGERRTSPSPSSSLQPPGSKHPPMVASFNSFAASVLPLPIQSKYSLFPSNNNNNNASTARS
jgi:hypothetical protein